MSQQIAQTILQQLGGRQFIMMTGSKNFIATDKGLSMKLSRNQSGANYLRINLTPMDVYTMEFISIRGSKMTTKKTMSDVYCDQLRNLFTNITGLETRLF